VKVCDYWQCPNPNCTYRYWFLYGRNKVICEHCRMRCIPISLATWARPDRPNGQRDPAVTVIDTSNPDQIPSFLWRELPHRGSSSSLM
jgi:hypothetical protein